MSGVSASECRPVWAELADPFVDELFVEFSAEFSGEFSAEFSGEFFVNFSVSTVEHYRARE